MDKWGPQDWEIQWLSKVLQQGEAELGFDLSPFLPPTLPALEYFTSFPTNRCLHLLYAGYLLKGVLVLTPSLLQPHDPHWGPLNTHYTESHTSKQTASPRPLCCFLRLLGRLTPRSSSLAQLSPQRTIRNVNNGYTLLPSSSPLDHWHQSSCD